MLANLPMHIILFILASIFVMSSSSFWSMWVSLELYSLFLTPWLMELQSKISKTNIFFYFLMQFLASVGFLVGSLTLLNSFCLMILFMSLLMKMSCFPFHSWFVKIMPALRWDKILVLVTLSKFVPLAMLGLFVPPNGYVWVLMLGLTMSLGGFEVGCLRKLVAYSSIAHSTWLVISMCLNKGVAISYMICYSLAVIPLCLLFSVSGMVSMKATLATKKAKIQLILFALGMSGVPPFVGFIPKLLAIQTLIQNSAFVEAGVLGVLSMLPIYFYFKIGSLSLGMNSKTEFQFSYSQGSLLTIMIGICIMILFLLLSLSLSLKH